MKDFALKTLSSLIPVRDRSHAECVRRMRGELQKSGGGLLKARRCPEYRRGAKRGAFFAPD
jgi:hypothetical protein